jgi:ADP-L-glycero-D-manno-heptose 6-epimerase
MILVTGHEGFIGNALTKFLKGKGFEVMGMEKEYLAKRNWQVIILRYLETLRPKAVFHVGGCADTQNYDVNYMMKHNVECTMLISNWCERSNIPMIYSSSASCYGVDDAPNTLYGWSKYLGEQIVIQNNQVALRYFNVYGFDESKKGVMSSIAYQSYMKHSIGETFKLFPCSPKRDFIFIKDVVNANYLGLMNYNENRGRYFDVGTGNSRTFEDILDIVGAKYTYLEEDKIPKNYQFNTQANKDKFLYGWKPYYSLEQGLDTYLRQLDN